jgi:hypothetical protein
MIACPASLRLAAHATHEVGETDVDVVAHLDGCAPCRALVAEQREIRRLAAGIAPPRALARSRREELAAEIMAHADVAQTPDAPDEAAEAREQGVFARRRRRVAGVIFATTIAAAAALVIVAMTSATTKKPAEVAATPTHTMPEPPAEVPTVVPVPIRPPAPAQQAASVSGAKAEFSRETTTGSDVVRLRDGELAIDALATRAVEVIAGTTRIAIPTSTKVTVVARAGVIESVAVFAGSVEVVAGDRKATVAAGAVWERTTIKLADKPAVREASDAERKATASSSLQAFRDGWTALRARDHRTAIAAFDRATDPVVAEDAAYWAANATERAGDRADAAKRYADFAARFPGSPRAGAATAAIARLTRN